MIKTILKINCLFIFFSCSNSEYNQEAEAEKVNDEYHEKFDDEYPKNYKTLNIKGNVKSITCTNYKQFIPDSLLGWFFIKEDYVFSKRGNVVIEEKSYTVGKKFPYRKVYEYDKMNNITKCEYYERDGEKTDIITYFYNKQGKLLRKKSEQVGKVIIEVINKYEILRDDYNKYKSYTRGSTDSEYYMTSTYSKGKILSKSLEVSGVTILTVYKYNALGRMTELGFCENNDTTKFSANETFIYDKNGKLRRHDFLLPGNVYIYDEYENIVSQIAGTNNSFNAEYIYDKKNNWIKRTSYLPNGKLMSILERKIEYFD